MHSFGSVFFGVSGYQDFSWFSWDPPTRPDTFAGTMSKLIQQWGTPGESLKRELEKQQKNQQRQKLPKNVIKIVATQPYDPEGRIEHWSWLINVLRLEMALRVCWVTKCSRWQVGKMDIFCSIFLYQMAEFHYIIFQWCAVCIFTCLRSKKWALYTQIHAHSRGRERERELHSSLSKSFKTRYISKNSQIFPACTSIFYTLA